MSLSRCFPQPPSPYCYCVPGAPQYWGLLTASPSQCCSFCLQRDGLASPFLPWAQHQGGGDARLRFLLTPQSLEEDSSVVDFSPPRR